MARRKDCGLVWGACAAATRFTRAAPTPSRAEARCKKSNPE
jgi:hypothetical protein